MGPAKRPQGELRALAIDQLWSFPWDTSLWKRHQPDGGPCYLEVSPFVYCRWRMADREDYHEFWWY